MERPASAPDAPVSSTLEGVRTHRVLVVEDNPDVSKTLKEWLSLSGHQVQVAGDALAAG